MYFARKGLAYSDEDSTFQDAVAGLHTNACYYAVELRSNIVLHLHSFKDENGFALLHCLPFADANFCYYAWQWCFDGCARASFAGGLWCFCCFGCLHGLSCGWSCNCLCRHIGQNILGELGALHFHFKGYSVYFNLCFLTAYTVYRHVVGSTVYGISVCLHCEMSL